MLWGIGVATQTPALFLSGGMLERASLPTATAGAMRSRKALIEQGAQVGSVGGTVAYVLYGSGTAMQLLGGAVFIIGLHDQGAAFEQEFRVVGYIGGGLLYGTGGLIRFARWAGTGAQLGANGAARRSLVASNEAPRSDARNNWVKVDVRPMIKHTGAVLSVTGW